MPTCALAPLPRPLPSLRLLRAEGRVRALLDDVLRLDGEREELERELGAFSAEWERQAGHALAELDDAERLVRRVRRLEDELAAMAGSARGDAAGEVDAAGDLAGRSPDGAGSSPPRSAQQRRTVRPPLRPSWAAGRGARRGGAASGSPRHGADADEPVVVEPEELALKRLHRRLARAIHPDLATGELERARFEEWMARVNSAYHRHDLAALEILAERIGLGAPAGEPSEGERLARLERRAIALAAARATLERALTRLRASEACRLRREWQRSSSAGGDLAAETRASAAERTATAHVDAMERLGACIARAAELEQLRRGAARGGRSRGSPPRRRDDGVRDAAARARAAFADGPLARRGLALAEMGRPGVRALELARELEELARLPEPWEPALTLLAFFAEAGGRVPEALRDLAVLAERWDALRAGWPRAPDLARALSRLPRHLEVGLRYRGDALAAGLQLTTAEGLAAVRHALASGALRPLARDVLAALGPAERCDACSADVLAIHLLRTRGLDEVHGLACPRCGAVLRSYWHYGDAEGIEALAPLAVEIGLVAEAHVIVGRRSVAFQMLPAQRAALTAERLASLFYGLYVAPHALPLEPQHLAFEAPGSAEPLAAVAPIPAGKAVRLRLARAAMREREVVSWMKERIERRFRR